MALFWSNSDLKGKGKRMLSIDSRTDENTARSFSESTFAGVLSPSETYNLWVEQHDNVWLIKSGIVGVRATSTLQLGTVIDGMMVMIERAVLCGTGWVELHGRHQDLIICNSGIIEGPGYIERVLAIPQGINIRIKNIRIGQLCMQDLRLMADLRWRVETIALFDKIIPAGSNRQADVEHTMKLLRSCGLAVGNRSSVDLDMAKRWEMSVGDMDFNAILGAKENQILDLLFAKLSTTDLKDVLDMRKKMADVESCWELFQQAVSIGGWDKPTGAISHFVEVFQPRSNS